MKRDIHKKKPALIPLRFVVYFLQPVFFSSAFVPSLSYSLYSMAWHGIQNNQPAIEDDVSTNI